MTNAIWIVCIVGVVAVVLFPLLAPPSDRSHVHWSCLNNLKEQALAVQVYWNDFDGKLPSSALVSGSKKWNKNDFAVFGGGSGALLPLPEVKRQTYTQVIYDYMKNKDIGSCPNDPMKDVAGAQSSYWWKTAVDKAWYGVGCKKKCQDEKDYAYNADQILLYEHREYHNGGVSLRDGAQINVVYMDSHVKNITLKNATSGDPVNLLAAEDGEPMYYNAQYDGETYRNLSDGVPATFTDPSRYVDQF